MRAYPDRIRGGKKKGVNNNEQICSIAHWAVFNSGDDSTGNDDETHMDNCGSNDDSD